MLRKKGEDKNVFGLIFFICYFFNSFYFDQFLRLNERDTMQKVLKRVSLCQNSAKPIEQNAVPWGSDGFFKLLLKAGKEKIRNLYVEGQLKPRNKHL